LTGNFLIARKFELQIGLPGNCQELGKCQEIPGNFMLTGIPVKRVHNDA
jgi:hypothetical protein